MIKGVHRMFYSSEIEELRAFIKDKLQFPFTDTGEGSLIIDLPEADIVCHPVEGEDEKYSGIHNISLYCDDVSQTVSELKSRGVEFTNEITNQSYGM